MTFLREIGYQLYERLTTSHIFKMMDKLHHIHDLDHLENE